MSNETILKHSTIRPQFYRITIRTLMGFLLFTAIAIGASHFFWQRRIITSVFVLPLVDVKVFEPHLVEIAEKSPNIATLVIDRRLNAIVFTGQARNTEAARKEIQDLVDHGPPAKTDNLLFLK